MCILLIDKLAPALMKQQILSCLFLFIVIEQFYIRFKPLNKIIKSHISVFEKIEPLNITLQCWINKVIISSISQ